MSDYDRDVGGKLKLKGKALDVKAGGVKKKKKKHNYSTKKASQEAKEDLSAGGSADLKDGPGDELEETDKLGDEVQPPARDDNLTPAERCYIEQRLRINTKILAKTSKSNRDHIEEFNQYLANMNACLRKTGLERTERLLMDLDWLRQRGFIIHKPWLPRTTYANYLKKISGSGAYTLHT